jgi:hypothetical protein
MALFGRNASLPKLRDLSLSAVRIDWDDAVASYQNLRRLELKNLTFDTGPSFEQFGTMLSASPRLESLNVSGFCPEPEGNPAIPVVDLPVLEDFTFGWKEPRCGSKLLQMFQIGRSLKSLTLGDAEYDYVALTERQSGEYTEDSREIFEALHNLGSEAPQSVDDTPRRGPFISTHWVRSLRIFWVDATGSSLVPLITMLTSLEDIRLEDVSEDVLKDVVSVLAKRDRAGRQLRVALRWAWEETVPGFAETPIEQLKSAGIQITTETGDSDKLDKVGHNRVVG